MDDHLGPSVVHVRTLGEQVGVCRRIRRDLVGLMPRRAARYPFVQARLPEDIALRDARALEDPVARVDHAVRRAGHDARPGEGHAEEVGLGFVVDVEPAFDALPGPVERIDIAVPDFHRVFVDELDLAVQAVAAEVHEPAAGFEHPVLEPVVHVPRPVFRMGGGDEHPVPVQWQRAVMELRLGVEIVAESLPFHPRQEPPLGRRHVAGRAAPDHVGGFRVRGDMIDGFRPVEGKRRVVVGAVHPVRRVGVTRQVVPGVDRGFRRKLVGVDVVAAAPEVVVGVPVDIGGQHGDVGRRLGGRDDPGEGKEPARLRGRVEVVQAGPFRRFDVLFVGGIRIALGIPPHAGPGVVAVGRDLHGGAWAVLVVPADVPN